MFLSAFPCYTNQPIRTKDTDEAVFFGCSIFSLNDGKKQKTIPTVLCGAVVCLCLYWVANPQTTYKSCQQYFQAQCICAAKGAVTKQLDLPGCCDGEQRQFPSLNLSVKRIKILSLRKATISFVPICNTTPNRWRQNHVHCKQNAAF